LILFNKYLLQFNWYARRVGLATIYKASELYMLQDSSPNYESTWKFLERRIADASLVHDVLIQGEEATQHLSQALTRQLEISWD
jgi:ubiquinone biosynthesis protein COQ9